MNKFWIWLKEKHLKQYRWIKKSALTFPKEMLIGYMMEYLFDKGFCFLKIIDSPDKRFAELKKYIKKIK